MLYKPFVKRKKWLYAGIVGLMLIAISANILVNFWLNPVFEKVIKKSVTDATEKKYKLDFTDLSLNILSNELVMNDLVFTTDTNYINTDSTNYYEIEIAKLNINVGSLWKMLITRNLVVDYIQAADPSVKLVRSAKKDNNTKDLYDTYSFFSGFLYSLKIYKTQFTNLSFNVYNHASDTLPGFTLKNIDAYFDYLSIDSDQLDKPGFSRYAEDFEIVFKNFSNTLPDSMYNIEAAEAKFSKKNNSVELKGLKLVPRYGKYEFARQVGHRVDRTELEVPDLTLSGVNFTQLLDHKILETTSITASGFRLKSFTDKRLELRPRKKKLITQMLLDIPFEFSADTIMVESGYLEYEEKTDNRDITGKVTFEDLYASLYKVSNQAHHVESDTMQADIKTKLMGKGEFDLSFEFPLGSSTGYHTIEGKLGNMSLTAINAILEPTARTTVESGSIEYLDFSMKIDDEEAEGIAHFAYHDLKVKLLKSNREDPELMENVASWLANVFIIKSNNPTNGGNLRDGLIYFVRNDEKSVFSYWVQALLIGIRESVGIKSIPKRLGSKGKEETS